MTRMNTPTHFIKINTAIGAVICISYTCKTRVAFQLWFRIEFTRDSINEKTDPRE